MPLPKSFQTKVKFATHPFAFIQVQVAPKSLPPDLGRTSLCANNMSTNEIHIFPPTCLFSFVEAFLQGP